MFPICRRCSDLRQPRPFRALPYYANSIFFLGDCSGLRVNLIKTEIFPIRCDKTTLATTLADFPGKIGTFPGKYLGLPLHTRKLRRVDIQRLLDKIGGRIQGWKGKLLSMAGRETLVKSVLTAHPIYHLIVFPMQKWLFKQIGKMRRSFFWKGEEPDKVNGGHCLINWPTVCTPKPFGRVRHLGPRTFSACPQITMDLVPMETQR